MLVAAEPLRARYIARIGCVQRGCHQTTYIHLCVFAEYDAVRVDQPDLTIGIDISQNIAALTAENPVDRQRRRIRLYKIHSLFFTDIETLPMDGNLGWSLLDGGGGDAGSACLVDLSL